MGAQLIEWDVAGSKFYESGVEKGVIYPINDSGVYTPGEAWSGLTNITEKPSGAEPTKIWADNKNYATLYSAEEFGLSVEAYMYPDAFANCDGSRVIAKGARVGQQPRKMFGLSYVSDISSDEQEEVGYKLHLVWGCKATPSEKAHATRNDSPEAPTMSWEISCTPVGMGTGFKDACHIEIDSRHADPEKLAALEQILYGEKASGSTGSDVPAMLPTPAVVISTLGLDTIADDDDEY